MSSIYILEPPTSGKVLLKTSVGDIDVELWAKETPKTCRNFVQLCLEGYYDNTIFHRVVKGFIAQGGDPNADGTGGDSIYGEPFKDEFHQRLKFNRRGLLAMANGGKDDNGSQFFFTLGATPELQDKHTIFGKITGETVFNMLKLEEGLIRDERPVYPHKIIKIEVLNNPFSDIEPRVKEKVVKEKKKKEKKKGVKNFKLLSFGEEAEKDEEEAAKESEKITGKIKSTYDMLDDEKPSSAPAEEIKTERKTVQINKYEDVEEDNTGDEDVGEAEEVDPTMQLERIRRKLQKGKNKKEQLHQAAIEAGETTYESVMEEERLEKKKRAYDEIQNEIKNVKQEYHKNKLKRKEEEKLQEKQNEKNETIEEYKSEYDKYKSKNKALPKKGAVREKFTLELLDKFKRKIQTLKDGDEEEDAVKDEEEAWLRHRLRFQEKTPILAKDASKKDDDWFDIYDPRNALNKRRRGETTSTFKK